MEEILNIVIDTISTLLLVFEDTESSTLNKMIVNTTPKLDSAVSSLVGMAEKISGGLSGELKNQMEYVIKEMKQTSAFLKTFGSKQLGADEGRVVMDTIKQLLLQSIQMMKIHDEHKVKVIVQAGKQATAALSRLHKLQNAKAVEVNGTECSSLLINLSSLFFQRKDLTSNPRLKEILAESAQNLKQFTPQVIGIQKIAIDYPDNTDVLQKRDQIFTSLINAMSSGMSAVTQSAFLLSSFDIDYFFPKGGLRKQIDPNLASRIARLREEIAKHLAILETTAKDGQQMAASGREIVAKAREQVSIARDLASATSHTEKKALLQFSAEELERILPKALTAMKASLAHPGDEQVEKDFKDVLKQVDEASAQLVQATLCSTMDANITTLLDAMNYGDEEQALEASQRIVENLKHQIKFIKDAANNTTDPVQKQRFLDTASTLSDAMDKLVPSVTNTLKNPNDEEAKKKLEDIIVELQKATLEISKSSLHKIGNATLVILHQLPKVANTDEIQVITSGSTISNALSDLVTSVDRGGEGAVDKAKELTSECQNLISAAKKVAQICGDPALEREMNENCAKFEKLVPKLIVAMKASLQSPNDKFVRAAFQEVLQEAQELDKKLCDNVLSSVMRREQKRRLSGRKVDVRVPVDVASLIQPLYEVESAPDQQTVAKSSKTIASELEKMCVAININDKAGMINAAKTIAGSVGDIQNLARDVAMKITDPKLKEAVLNSSLVPQNFATQLRIISAVKLAQTQPDKSAEQQLYNCAKKLALSMANFIESMEIASLAMTDNTNKYMP